MATHDYRITNYSYIHSHKEEDFQVFLDTIDPVDGNFILEAFCGYGETTQKLLAREASLGISCKHYLSDASQTQIDRAKEALGENQNVKEIVLSDARKLPYKDEIFDIVVVKMGLHETDKESQGQIISELYRVLKQGGKFVTWEIALPEDRDLQTVFEKVIYRKNELAGFYDINRSRHYPRESEILELFKGSGFSKYEKVHDIWYLFESIRRKEELVSVEKKLLGEESSSANADFLEKLSEYRLSELNKSIREIVPDDIKEKLEYKELGDNNISFLAHKAIFYGIK